MKISVQTIRRHFLMKHLCDALHKRIIAEVSGHPIDTKVLQKQTREEAHRDVQQAYRDRDFDLLAAYGKFLSPVYGTVHVRLAAGAVQSSDSYSHLLTALTPEILNTAGRVGVALRDMDTTYLWRKQDVMVALTAAVIAHPEYEYSILDLVRKHGVPRLDQVQPFLAQVVPNQSLVSDEY